eukprot:SAG31_NODE_42953_length_269_cov_0.752941_1_plen_73_part_01
MVSGETTSDTDKENTCTRTRICIMEAGSVVTGMARVSTSSQRSSASSSVRLKRPQHPSAPSCSLHVLLLLKPT